MAKPPVALPMPIVTRTPISTITPSTDQVVILYVIIAMAVIVFGFWNVPIVRNLINPLKLFTIGWHELCHVCAGVLTGGRILKMTIDPHVGGATIVEGGRPWLILSAGYVGSTLFGGLFVLAAWHTLVAKIMSFVLGVGLVLPLALVRDKLTILLTAVYEGLLVGFWFIDHAQPLRWYCLLIGIMNVFFVVWDVADDRFFHKTNDSDATQFALLCPGIGAHVWAILWVFFELVILTGFVLLGITVFKVSVAQMNQQAAAFLPT